MKLRLHSVQKKIVLLSFLIFCLSIHSKAQIFGLQVTELSPMPIPISNNAVTEGWANDTAYMYSFGGIDSTKIWSGINKKSFRYNTVTDAWDTIPDLPNPNAVIAAGASYVDSIIYIMGGYQVLSNGSEISSNIVNRFDPRTNTYLSNGTNIPLAIDDHVQAVYKDSLIYLITGWSNTGNFPNVQIYDPSNNIWLTGTPVPNNNIYKAFGASGIIIGNTIYYHGGASTASNFPGQSTLRIGQIDPNDPTQISWTTNSTPFITYRAVCTIGSAFNRPYWIGGSETTYNFNGIAYNGSGGVSPRSNFFVTNGGGIQSYPSNLPLPMDLRGIASFSNAIKYIAGGMLNNQKVSNKTFFLQPHATISISENNNGKSFQLYPNPTSEKINLVFKTKEVRAILILDVMGKEIFRTKNNAFNLQINARSYPKGIYFVNVKTKKGNSSQKIIVQ